ncbi:hypothetical protein A2995_00430 [Candidatus Nomurabacteria bacterium RIFCSPLOWO2_01_FULL_33_24]|uniref:Cell division protein FtsX n=1 Tax=Candidatus Nomurabacteria bacterium RIFCSPLOWO2_01_FULL_33_24 TaxID=1801765 RepID=A0A1F6WYR9_9BACT|nr:MAG: hypothetical protein A2995_00430 [Candidatus Nomurabacteria bacterium RIFCSPLOWO2_01_FULL_33_24]
MFWLDTKRVIKSGFINFIRSSLISLSSVLVVTITLSIIASLIFLQAILQFSLSEMEDKVDVTIYFTVGAPEEQILNLKSSLEELPEVASVGYLTSDEAIRDFRLRHTDDYLTLQALEETGKNPLGASLNIRAQEPSQYESIATFLEGDSAVVVETSDIIDGDINYYKNKEIIDKLTSIINSSQQLGFFFTFIFIIISIIITFNTIRLTIYVAREEIEVMRLVGAGNKYIRGPFMVEGVIYGVISSLITIIIFYPITSWFGREMSSFFGMNLSEYYLNNFFQIFIIILLSGVALGTISSFLAVRKYLNK